jgi:tetratricopeptide (TPR) repeat protein
MNSPPSSGAPGALKTRQRVGRWLFAAVVLGSALALGGLITWVMCVITGALAIATFLLWFDAEGAWARPAAGTLVVTAIGLVAWTALQCVPLPLGLLWKVAPQNADVWSRALMPLNEPGPARGTLSLDPMATRVQVLRGVAYLLALLSALRIAQRREGVVFLVRTLALSALVLAFAALAHPALGAEKVFWIYEPVNRARIAARHIAPLLNANHLAAYLDIGICVALASALAPKPAISRPIAFAAFLMMLATEVWVGSRGGVGATVLGIVIVVVLTRAARRVEHSVGMGALALGVVFIAGAAMLALSASEEAWQELATSDVSKLQLSREAMRLIRLFPFFGAGRGAFEVAFPAVRTIPGYVDFTHPENVIAQWTTEWGIPVAVVAAAAIAWALRPATVMARSQPPVGAWAAIAAVAVHNIVDYSLEVPGVVVALVTCAAIVAGGSGSGGQVSFRSAWSQRTRPIAFGALALAVLAIAIVVPGIDHELADERSAMRAVALDTSLGQDEFHDAARAAMLRHPAEPYFPFVGALRAYRARDESVIPWVERTLERSPVYGPAHLVLAQSLITRSPSQARLEYRLALAQDTTTSDAFRAAVPRLVDSFDDAVEMVPPHGPAHGFALVILLELVRDALPATRVRLDAELAASEPEATDPARRAAHDALYDLGAGDAAPWCDADRAACAARGVAFAERVKRARPDACEGYLLHAKLLVAEGEPRRGLDELDDAADKVQDWGTCLRELVQISRAQKDETRATAALDRLTRAGCVSDDECAQNLLYVATVEIERGNPRRALALYKKAYEKSPDDDLLASDAALAARVGLHAEALQTYMKLVERHPGDARWSTAAATERDAVARSIVPPM